MRRLGMLSMMVLFTAVFTAGRIDFTAGNEPMRSVTPEAKPDVDWWTARHAAKKEEAKSHPVDTVFIGDSITHGWEVQFSTAGYGLGLSEEAQQYYKEGAGLVVFNERLADKNILNIGFGGDETQNLLWRLNDGILDGLHPKHLVLMIGINNIAVSQMTAEEVFAGTKAVIEKVHELVPETEVILMAVLPIHTADARNDAWEGEVERLNPMLKDYAESEGLVFLELGPKLTDENGVPRMQLMPDGVHPNADGYRIWADMLMPYLN